MEYNFKEEIGRIRGAAGAIADGVIAAQFRSLADQADAILAEVVGQPQRLGLARRFFSSLLPRAADLAEGYHRADRGSANETKVAQKIRERACDYATVRTCLLRPDSPKGRSSVPLRAPCHLRHSLSPRGSVADDEFQARLDRCARAA